jgi:hypothetical protein
MTRVKLRDKEEDAIVQMAVRSVMKCGKRYPNDISEMLPMWKDTTMYERGIFLNHLIFTEHAPAWKVKKAIQSADHDEFFLPDYDRDFFQGLFDSSSKMYSNGNYKRAEFGGRPLLKEFLSSSIHGQNIQFADMSGDRSRLNRTNSLPFMEIPGKENMERWFIGVMCGSDIKIVNGEPLMRIRSECVPNMTRLGISFKESSQKGSVLVSLFYVVLFMSEMPDFFLHHWMSIIPHRGLGSTPEASTDALMHWRVISKGKLVRDALPFLLDAKENNRMGIKVSEVDKMMKKRKFKFVDKRITSKCERWIKLSLIEKETEGEMV